MLSKVCEGIKTWIAPPAASIPEVTADEKIGTVNVPYGKVDGSNCFVL